MRSIGIAKEFHDSIVDLVKRKRLSTEVKAKKLVEVRITLIDEAAVEDNFTDIYYTKPH